MTFSDRFSKIKHSFSERVWINIILRSHSGTHSFNIRFTSSVSNTINNEGCFDQKNHEFDEKILSKLEDVQ